jgi:peptide-methionine (S)-S-oxide reductase
MTLASIPFLARRQMLRFLPAVLASLFIGVAALPAATAESAQTLPAPTYHEPKTTATSQVAVLAGGCFWGVQGVYQHVKGVSEAVAGYDGGDKQTAHYEMTSGGRTGHAESVRITFDPQKIGYGQILQIFFSVVHDPTELNYQGPDEGTQYRSAIFPTDPAQAEVALRYIDQLDAAHAFKKPIVTTIEMGKTFYPAEAYHQNFLATHPHYPYIVFNDLPKIERLKQLMPAFYRDKPVLVAMKQN